MALVQGLTTEAAFELQFDGHEDRVHEDTKPRQAIQPIDEFHLVVFAEGPLCNHRRAVTAQRLAAGAGLLLLLVRLAQNLHHFLGGQLWLC